MNDEYDPDMDVGEALRKGLIAIIETGNCGAHPNGFCGAVEGKRTEFYCARSKGHTGDHAVVVRWERTVDPSRLDETAARASARNQAMGRAEIAAAQVQWQTNITQLERLREQEIAAHQAMLAAEKAAVEMAAYQNAKQREAWLGVGGIFGRKKKPINPKGQR